ncbi:MAG TPA: hypothetical protein VI357_20355 [Mycobacteriales bacterium]
MSRPPESSSGATAAPRRRDGFLAWARRPSTAVALLGIAVVVGVVQGQPPPASRDSGRSVPAEQSYTGSVGPLLVVVDGALVRFDTLSKRTTRVPLPRGVTALRAWNQQGHDVVLGRLRTNRTVAYVLTAGRARALGPAELIVPSADRQAVWVVSKGVATRQPLGAGPRRAQRLPPKSRLVADTRQGLIVSTGTVPDLPVAPGREPITPTPVTPTPTTPGPTGTVPATAGGTPHSTGSPGTPAPTLSPRPTTPPYTTASPVPSTGPDGVPLTTLVVGPDGRTRFLAAAEALDAVGDVVLLRDDERRLAVISPRPGVRKPRLLPSLAAIQVTGPGTLDARGNTFAVLGRTNDHAWLVVGPAAAETNGELNVVALDGGAPVPEAAAPTFTVSGRVLAVRPDGRIVYYAPGERDGFTVGDELPPATAVAQA